MVAVDLDDDEHIDVIGCTDEDFPRVIVNYNIGGVSWERQELEVPLFVFRLAIADVNEDGRRDIICVLNNGYLAWLENHGSRSFEFRYLTANSLDAPALLIADIDHDDRSEIFVAHGNSPHAIFIYNDWQDGDPGVLGSVAMVPGSNDYGPVISMGVADFNNDTFLDLAVVTNDSRVYIHMFDNSSSPYYRTGDLVYAGNSPVMSTVTGVFNNIEIASLSSNSSTDILIAFTYTDKLVYIHDLSGNGTKWQEVVIDDQNSTSEDDTDYLIAAAGADIDGDGDLDIVAYRARGRQLSVYENLGHGNFDSEQTLYSIRRLCGLHILGSVPLGDFDGDGHVDLAFRVALQ